jgi:histidine ammonia-lyase
MWNPRSCAWEEAGAVLSEFQLEPLSLKAKEGLALINGTQLITSLGAEALTRAVTCARAADVIAALTLEALRGTYRAFQPEIHAVCAT